MPKRHLARARANAVAVASLPIALVSLAIASSCADDVAHVAVGDAAPEGDGSSTMFDANDSSVADADANTTDAPVHADFGLDTRPANTSCRIASRPSPPGPIGLQRVYANLSLVDGAVMIAQPPNDKTRWFAAQLKGKVVSFPFVAPTSATVVADVPALAGIPLSLAGESGLLGFAFHPKFAQTGRLYVSWTSADGPTNERSRVGYLTSTDSGQSFTSYTNILVFDEPLVEHHGGGLAFGPDGFLYASFGDGGEPTNGQSKTGFFSKILRIDVDNVPAGKTYGIPTDNPFALGGGEPATFAYGFRNPFRFSFDRVTGDLWVGDVGAQLYEEIDLVKRGGNYGWACREGAHDFGTDPSCATAKLGAIDPVAELGPTPTTASAIMGGIVYRGAAIPSLVGSYIFGDWPNQEVSKMSFDPTTGAPAITKINDQGPPVAVGSFAEDLDGEVYAVGLDGQIFKVVSTANPDAGAPALFPDRLSTTGCDPRVATGLIPYTVTSPLWSDGADKERWLALPDGKTMNVGADGDFDLPIGSVAIKTFTVDAKRIETRLLVRHADGDWAGYSYAWLDDQSDAVLLSAGAKKDLGAGRSWMFPSRADCPRCHTAAANHILGIELGQLNVDFLYTSTNRIANQLKTFEHIGLLTAPLGTSASQIVTYPSPTGTSGTLEQRARSYLHANCSMCHRSGGPTAFDMDLRFSTPFADTKTCNVPASTGDLGIAGARRLVPGDAAKSQISLRPHALDAQRMPPLVSGVVDVAGLAVIDAWIGAVTTCP